MEKEKQSFKKWFDNYWYHYKWPTILGIFLLFVLIVGIVQCSARVESDVIMMYAGPKQLSFDEIRLLKESAAKVMEQDYNGDGSKIVEYLENVVIVEDYTVEDLNGEEQVLIDKQEQIEQYVTQVAAGDAQIYFLSADVYHDLSRQGVLVPLEDVFETVPIENFDSFSFELGVLGIHEMPGFSSLPEKTYVCLRAAKTMGVLDPEQAEKEHEWALDLFRALVSYQPV